jgi:hypothetical protein
MIIFDEYERVKRLLYFRTVYYILFSHSSFFLKGLCVIKIWFLFALHQIYGIVSQNLGPPQKLQKYCLNFEGKHQ